MSLYCGDAPMCLYCRDTCVPLYRGDACMPPYCCNTHVPLYRWETCMPPTSVPCFSRFWNWGQNSRRRIHLSFSGSVSPGSSDPFAKADVSHGACHQPSPGSLTATSLAIRQLPPLQKMPQTLVGGSKQWWCFPSSLSCQKSSAVPKHVCEFA